MFFNITTREAVTLHCMSIHWLKTTRFS